MDQGAERLLRLLTATAVGGLAGPAGALTAFIGSGASEIIGLVFEDDDTRRQAETALGNLNEATEAIFTAHTPDTRALALLDFDPDRAADETLRRAEAAGKAIDEAMRQPLSDAFAALCAGPDLQSAFRREVTQRMEGMEEQLKRLLAPVELLHIPRPSTPLKRAAPSNLLRADYQVVPYEPRPEFEAELQAWCNDEDDYPKLRLYTAPGGAGKSRFFIQWCQRLDSRWQAGFLEANPKGDLTHLARATRPLFLVVDYADGRNDEVTALLAALQRHAANRRVRVILLARNAGPWVDNYCIGDPDARELFKQEASKELPSLGHDERDRPALFLRAFNAFKEHAGRFDRAPDAIGEPEIPDLTGEAFDNALLIHTAAYLTVAGDTALSGDQGRLFERVMEHEKSYWKKARPEELSNERMLESMGRLTALTTLAGGITNEQLKEWLERMPTDLTAIERPLIGKRLLQLYPAADGVAPLLPDRLGEWWVNTRLAAHPDLLPAAFAAEADDRAVTNGLTVLARIAQRNEEKGETWLARALTHDFARLSPLALEIATTEWEGLGRLLHRRMKAFPDPVTAQRLGDILDTKYQQTLALRELAEEATRQRLNAVGGEDEAALTERAWHLNNLSFRLGELGRREEAIDAARESVTIHRQLAEARPGAFLPELAMSLNNLAIELGKLGRRNEALKSIREASEVYRQLAKAQPSTFLNNLAACLINLSNHLGDLGRREEALDTAREAVTIRRRLTEARTDAYLPDLALSLINLASRLSNQNRREEALHAAHEAADLYRQLSEVRPDAFLPDLAISLNNISAFFHNLDRREEALGSAREAVTLRRQLAEARPDVFTEELCQSLGTLGSAIAADGGGHDEAATAFAEGIERLTPHLQQRPATFQKLMHALLSHYNDQCRKLEREPDPTLLGPVEEVFQKHPQLGPLEEAFQKLLEQEK